MDEKKYILMPKVAIKEIYKTLISLQDEIRGLNKTLSKINVSVTKTVKNQSELIGWVGTLEERLILALDVVGGEISREEYDELINSEENNEENSEENDEDGEVNNYG